MEQDDNDSIELWDIGTVCRFFGGTGRPLHPSTIYRGMAMTPPRFPRPMDITPNVKRWSGAECRETVQRMLNERANSKPPSKRGRPKKVKEEPVVESKSQAKPPRRAPARSKDAR